MLFSQLASFGQKVANEGKVIDSDTKDPLVLAYIEVDDSGLGVFTNSAGNFSITYPLNSGKISISLKGYETSFLKLDSENIEIIELKKARITKPKKGDYPSDSLRIMISKAIDKIGANYIASNRFYEVFHREFQESTSNKEKPRTELGEELLLVERHPYTEKEKDNFRYIKGRQINTYESGKRNVHEKGSGKTKDLFLRDFVRNPNDFEVVEEGDGERFKLPITQNNLDYYNFKLLEKVYDGKSLAYLIYFGKGKNASLYEGTFLLDSASLSFLEIEARLNKKALRQIVSENFFERVAFKLFARFAGLSMKFKAVQFHMKYDVTNNKSALVYSRFDNLSRTKMKRAGKKEIILISNVDEYFITKEVSEGAYKQFSAPTLKRSKSSNQSVSGDEFWGNYNFIMLDGL